MGGVGWRIGRRAECGVVGWYDSMLEMGAVGCCVRCCFLVGAFVGFWQGV